MSNPQRILEPSAGTCEIANYAHLTSPPNAVEFNDTIYNDVAQTVDYKYIHTKWSPSYTFDLIVGNPPYVVCGKGDVPEKYHDYVVGRLNLFCTFMLHSISMLSPGGVIAFIIPTSLINAAFYAKIRNYMKTEGTILNIVNFASDSKFIEIQQATIGLVYRKESVLTPMECKFSVKFGDNYIFTENSETIKTVLSGSTTLTKM